MDPHNTADAQAPSNLYAAPEARIAETFAGHDGLSRAGRMARLLAVLIDSIIIVIPVLIAIAIPAYQGYVQRASGQVATANGAVAGGFLIGLGLLGIAYAIYQLYWLWKNGQTLGKKLMNIKIVRQDGSRAGLRRIFLMRMLLPGLIGAIPLVGGLFALIDPLFIFGEEKRCVHDMIADTIVINA